MSRVHILTPPIYTYFTSSQLLCSKLFLIIFFSKCVWQNFGRAFVPRATRVGAAACAGAIFFGRRYSGHPATFFFAPGDARGFILFKNGVFLKSETGVKFSGKNFATVGLSSHLQQYY